MLRQLASAAALTAILSVSAVPTASAQVVQWFGGGVLTDVTNCPSGSLAAATNRAFQARYRHPNVGSNGPDAQLSLFFTNYTSFNFTRAGGPFANVFEPVQGTFVAAGGGRDRPRVRMLRQEPDAIDDTTPSIFFRAIVKKFSAKFPGNENCTIRFEALLIKQ